MRKKLILLTCVLLCLTLFVGVLVACDPDSAEDGTQTPGDATKPGDITTPGDDTTTPGGDEQGGVPDEPIQEEAYIEAAVVAAIAAAADKAIKNVHASEPWQMMIYAFDNSDLEYIADYGLYDPEEPTPGVIAGGFVNADSYSEVEGQEGYSGDECVYFMAYETAEQANAAGISHFGKGAWASVLPAPGAYADKVVRVVGNCVLVAPSDEVLDAFLAGGEKQTEGFIAVCMQIMQSVKEDLACAEMSVGRGSGGCTVYVQSTVNPQYSSEFKTLQAEYFVDEKSLPRTAAISVKAVRHGKRRVLRVCTEYAPSRDCTFRFPRTAHTP